MGSRLLKKWMLLPLMDLEQIKSRQKVIAEYLKEADIMDVVAEKLKQIGDLERLISKAALRKINPKEIVHLRNSLSALAKRMAIFSFVSVAFPRKRFSNSFLLGGCTKTAKVFSGNCFLIFKPPITSISNITEPYIPLRRR